MLDIAGPVRRALRNASYDNYGGLSKSESFAARHAAVAEFGRTRQAYWDHMKEHDCRDDVERAATRRPGFPWGSQPAYEAGVWSRR